MTQSAGPTKRDRRAQSREDRRNRVEQARQRQKTRRRLIIGGLIGLAIVVFVGLLWLVLSSRETIGRSVPIEGQTHVDEGTPIAYQSRPPASGPHYPVTAPYAVSEQPIPAGYWVHNLEHGGIVVLWNCPQGCPDTVAQIKDAFVKLPRSRQFNRVKLVGTPYTEMDSKIAYVAWGKIQELDEFDYDQLLRFYNAYVDKGPEQAL
ncbi:MAG TPA: DUF3105 domain-containing protein [Chloroflexota bacterium]|nr:DUF3105 domain-containing protein [Chloroflexota bacterium]